jgi:hypothetical protein
MTKTAAAHVKAIRGIQQGLFVDEATRVAQGLA